MQVKVLSTLNTYKNPQNNFSVRKSIHFSMNTLNVIIDPFSLFALASRKHRNVSQILVSNYTKSYGTFILKCYP